MRTIRSLSAVLLAASLIAGCASLAPTGRPVGADAPPPSTTVAPPAPPPMVQSAPRATRSAPAAVLPPLPTAARSLSAQAERASQAGDHEAAADYLERALRIASNHPVLWQNLAVVRYRQQAYDRAEGLALKSNALAAGIPNLQAHNWQLIAEARRLRGDLKGADSALAEARRLAAAAGGR